MREIVSPLDGFLSPFGRISGSGGAWSPASLFASGENGVWYEISPTTCFTDTAGTTAAGVGDAVARINDLSGNNNHATQVTAAARPLLQQTAGGLYYLDFDGVDDVLFRSPFSFTEEVSFFMGSQNSEMSLSDLSSDKNYIRLIDSDPLFAANIRDDSANDIITALAVSNPVVCAAIFEGVATGGTYRLRVDGVEETPATATATPSNIDTFAIGALLRSGSNYIAGKFFAGIATNRLLTAQEISDTENYLATKSGVTL